MAELVAKVYSQALFEVGVEKNSLDLYREELEIITAACRDYPDFYEILKSPKIKIDEKKRVVYDVFGKNQSVEINNFIKTILDKRRIKDLFKIAKEFEDLIYKHKGIVKATAYTIKPLTVEEQLALKEKLQHLTNKKIELINRIDVNLLGGVMIKLGDKVIDGTLRGKLNRLQNSLKEIIVQDRGEKKQ
ncbi:MAG: ATP synthase subunit delta [Clostridiales bacterium 38_11]|nr:MAG: ATP synthase subunit delta [Clostridiales bacterium 38_11]HBH11720.1 F0F1 ATP synthase subunit delta [Clostridiales bacterium]